MSKLQTKPVPQSPQVTHWRKYTKEEMLAYIDRIRKRTDEIEIKKRRRRKRPSLIVVRDKISTLDMYCYLKARFGKPDGFQTFIARDDSDNWIHWDYNIKAGKADIHISGMSRETHILTSEDLTDEQWRDLIVNIKLDFARVGKEKSQVLKSLEKWAVFQNKFVEIATLCSHKHGLISDYLLNRPIFKPLSIKSKKDAGNWSKAMSDQNKKRADMSAACLELSLLTPVMAESFINMIILMLCKPEIRDNKRQFEGFVREQIDVKIFDLPYKCQGFATGIDTTHSAFVSFKRVMDKRNHAIHGNIDPDREKVETVYFEGKKPLFPETGDHIGKFIESIEQQAQPEVVLKDYEDTHEFLSYIATRLEIDLQFGFWRIMEDHYPGFDIKRKKTGALFPNHIVTGRHEGMTYDGDLKVSWEI